MYALAICILQMIQNSYNIFVTSRFVAYLEQCL